jgi:hypothetical protein
MKNAPRLAFALVTLSLAACGDPGTSGGMGELGVAGASCLRTPDCQPPLQCIANVCTALSGDTTGGMSDVPDVVDTSSEPQDTVNPFYDGPPPDVVTDYDASDWEFLDAPPPSDTNNLPDGSFGGCADLGVSDTWSGTFLGAVDFSVTPNPLTPSEGTLPVSGELAFDIRCIESKLIVRGTMDGLATVEGQGDFPFTMKLDGVYDPETQRMQTEMVDAQVNLYDLIIVYFEGTLSGQIGTDGRFTGTWEGESTGTNQQFITGTASGEGVWGAGPQ